MRSTGASSTTSTELRAGRWNKKEFSKASGLFGRTLGLLGFGSIGQEVARRARAFGMPVVVWSRRFAGSVDARREASKSMVSRSATSPEDVVARADIISVHLALAQDTRGFVDAEVAGTRQARCDAHQHRPRRGARLRARWRRLSATRGCAWRSTSTRTSRRPAKAASTIRSWRCPNVIGTHHIGASTDQAQEAIAAETVRIVRTFVETGRVPNVVNLAKKTPATHMLVVRHRDKPGVLAHVFERLRDAHLNVQETENIIFAGAHAAVARINLDGEPDTGTMNAIQAGNADILNLQLVKLR